MQIHPHPTTRVARGATYLFAQGLVSAFVGLAYFVVLARWLSPEEMGAFAVLTFIPNFLAVVGNFALSPAAVKYIAQYLAEGKVEKARSVAARVLQVCLLSSSVIFVLFFAFSESLSMRIFGTEDYAFMFRLVVSSAIFSILFLNVQSFLQGLQRIKEVAVIGLVFVVLQSAVSMYLLYLGLGLLGAVYGGLVGAIVSSLMGLVLTLKYLGISGEPHPARPLIDFAYPLYGANILGFLVGWVDQLVILNFMGTGYLGVYNVAVRALAVPNLFASSIVMALFPQLSELYAQQGSNSLKDIFPLSMRYALLTGFPIIVGLAILAYPIIIIFAGIQYAEAALPLTIISLSALPGTLGLAIGPMLMALERTKTVSIITVITILFNMMASYVALTQLNIGLAGVAWVRTISSLISFGLGIYVLGKAVSLVFDKEVLWKVSVASLIMTVTIFLLDGLKQILMPFSGKLLVFPSYLLPLYIVVGALAYFFSLVAMKTIKRGDVELFYDYLPRGLKWIAVWVGRIVSVDIIKREKREKLG